MRWFSVDKEKKFKGFWKHIFPYMKPFTKKLMFTSVCAMVVGVFVALQPLVIKWIVDDGISNNALDNSQKLKFVIEMCILYLIFSFGRVGFWATAYLNILKTLEGILFSIRSKFFAHVQNMCMRFYEKISVGELFNCIMGSPITNIKAYLNAIFLTVPYQAVSLVVSLIALYSYDVTMTLILLLTVVVMALVNYLSRRRVRTAYKDYIRTETQASQYLNDSLHGMEAIKLYSIEQNQLKTFKEFITSMYEKGLKANFKDYIARMWPELVNFVGTAVVYLVGAIACIYKGMSIGVLYAFLSSMGNILNIFITWLNMGIQKTSAEAGLHKILEILEEETDIPEVDEGHQRDIKIEKERAINKGISCISFEDADFGYENKKIFEKFNCKINYNESVALVGGSGSGKSTFTKLLMRLYDLDGGKVLLHGQDVKKYKSHDLRVTFGVVPQNPFIFYGTIWDNILIARPDATNKEVIKAMEIAHVHEFVNDLEYGWNTIVGDGALGLSGGQKQRIAIARAVLGDPDILIFDEATSALDNISERHIQQAMEELMKDHTVIIVAHRLSTIKNVDRILVFDNGEIVQQGSYDELSEKDGIFKNLLNAQ